MNTTTFANALGNPSAPLTGLLTSVLTNPTTDTAFPDPKFPQPTLIGAGGVILNAQIPLILRVPTSSQLSLGGGGNPQVTGYSPSNALYGAPSPLLQLDGRPFSVRLAGVATMQASNAKLTLHLWVRNSGDAQPTISGLNVFTSPDVLIGATSSNFLVDCAMIWDSVSQSLTGTFEGEIAGVVFPKTSFSVANVPGNPLGFYATGRILGTISHTVDSTIQLNTFEAQMW